MSDDKGQPFDESDLRKLLRAAAPPEPGVPYLVTVQGPVLERLVAERDQLELQVLELVKMLEAQSPREEPGHVIVNSLLGQRVKLPLSAIVGVLPVAINGAEAQGSMLIAQIAAWDKPVHEMFAMIAGKLTPSRVIIPRGPTPTS